ncbi:MAG: panthothenate synthetase [Pseudogulbenkiania sp.]|nr:panthothenate synthetase [Pseudogulbenkiania sp.]
MKMLMMVHFPHEPFNQMVREGRAGEVLMQILDEIKLESIYFTELNGTRSAVAVIDVDESSQIPRYAEPFFLQFEADCEFRIAMTPADLGRAGLEMLGKRWG